MEISRLQDALQCGWGRFCISAETERNQEFAAYLVSALSDLVQTIKLYGHITTSFSRSELLAGKMPVLLMLGDMTHPVL